MNHAIGNPKNMPTKQKGSDKKKKKEVVDQNDDAVQYEDTSTTFNEITTNHAYRLADLYYNKEYYMYRHLHHSYNKFIEEDVKIFLENGEHTFTEVITPTTYYRYRFKYENTRVDEPSLSNGVEPMFPSDARHNGLTYFIKLISDVTQYQDVIDIASDHKKTNIVGQRVTDYHVCTIPLMTRSKWCSLTTHRDMDKTECNYDPGGYFIVKGNEKVVISQDRMVENKPLVFIKKDSGAMSYIVQINSKSYKPNGMTQIMTVKLKKEGTMTIRVPILNEVNVCAVFRALGLESDRDIINYISYDEYDNDMLDLIRVSLDICKNEKGNKINSQEEAIDYLIPKMRVLKKYTETDKEIKLHQKKIHLKNLLQNNFLPHVDGSLRNKAQYLGYMINRLLRVYLGRIPLDDRDSYINKRVDLPGDLMFDLFKQQYKKLLSECKKFFDNRNKSDETPINVISSIKPGTIEQGFKASLSTGRWIRRQGVAQMLQRLTYLQTISFLRRVDAPGGDASTSKLTHPRYLHPSSVGFLCLDGEAEILLSNGVDTMKLKDLRDGNAVTTVDKKNLFEMPSRIFNCFSQKKENVIEIATISGRKLKCSKDHPILVQTDKGKYEMIDAGKLKIGDKVIVRHSQKHLPVDKEMNIILDKDEIMKENRNYVFDLHAFWKPDKIPQEKLEILARLIGASVTDGHISQKGGCVNGDDYYSAEFYLGEEMDALEILHDIQKLGFGSECYIAKQQSTHINKNNGKHTIYNTWRFAKGGAFGYLMVKMGAFVGNKTNQERKIPDWIVNGNKAIKREFLSGFNGGDGCRFSARHNQEEFKLSMGWTCQTTIDKFLKETIKYMETIKDLYEELGINGVIRTYPAEDDGKTKVLFCPSQSYENLGKFGDIIGYRYCNHKRRISAPTIEYVKYKNYLVSEKQEKYDKIIESHKQNMKPAEIVAETGIEYHFVKRILENYRKGKIPQPRECDGINGDTIKYNKFYDDYYINGLNLAIPIKSITEKDPELLYDFTTELFTHSLIANGFEISNCASETPEHAKVGLTKHLSLIGSVSIMSRDQYYTLKDYLLKRVTNVSDISPIKLRDADVYKVFLNGEWLGVTEKHVDLENDMMRLKLTGEFDQKNVSIVPDHEEGEIRVYCDTGRMIRPMFRVKDNNLLITKKHIESISLNKADKLKKITDWDEFLIKYPGTIEYIDTELQPYIMIADKVKNVKLMREKMINSIELSKNVKTRHVDNRYDDMFYDDFTHCEIHPALLVGEIITNIPFFDHNAGPRSIFAYAQGRQAMGIYATNYRDRLDISFILYYPQRPLVSTRTAKYTNSEILPAGENAVVAIMCYGGLTISPCHSKSYGKSELFWRRC